MVPRLSWLTYLQRCTTVDINGDMVADLLAGSLKKSVTDTLDNISNYCGVDIFLLGPKLTPIVDGLNGDSEIRRDQRWRVAIYGDILSSEHAKTRVLIHIDQMVRGLFGVWAAVANRFCSSTELSMHFGSSCPFNSLSAGATGRISS